MPDLKSELSTKLSMTPAPAHLYTPSKPKPPITKNRKTDRHMQSCSPHYVTILSEKVGPIRAASMVGLSDNALRNAIKRDVVTLVTEIAAKGVLAEIERIEGREAKAGPAHYYIAARVPAEKWAGLKTVAEAMGVKLNLLE